MSRERDTEQSLSPLHDVARPARREQVRGGQVESGFAPLAPRATGEILDAAIELLCGRAALLIGVCALLWLPVRILQPIFGVQPWEPGADMNALLGQLVGTAFLGLAGALMQSFANAVVTILVFRAAQGEPQGVAFALRRAVRRFPGLLVIAILTGIVSMIGMALCIVPYFFVAWKFALATSIYAIEDVSIAEALQRSFTLSIGSFLRWAGITIVTFVLVIPYSGLVGGVDHPLVLGWLSESVHVDRIVITIVIVVCTSLFMGVAAAGTGVITTVFYIDCLVRREGRDLRARVASLGAAESPAHARESGTRT